MHIVYQNFLFILILIFGTILTISSNSWLSAWIGLEINLIAFIILITNQNNFLSSESSLIYFIFQVFASLLFLFSILVYINSCIFFFIYKLLNINLIILVSLLIKIGRTPFHFWIPLIIENLNWFNNLILISWQKIAIIIIIIYCLKHNLFLLFIFLSSFIRAIKGFNQISIRKIIAYSSINHIRWIIRSILISEIIWKFYFFRYIIILINLIIIFYKFNLFYINQIFFFNIKINYIKFLLFFNILSIGGLPPFLGFFPKIVVIQELINFDYFLIIFIIINFSLIILFYYFRLIFSSFLLNSRNIKSFTILNKNNNFIFFFNFLNNILLLIIIIRYYY